MSLDKQLNHLEVAGLIRLVQLYPELEYFFRHALVQEATYQSLLKQDRRQLHKKVAEHLAAIYANRLDDVAATLAHHFEGADDHHRAAEFYQRAGAHAVSVYANPEAEQHFRKALALLPEDSIAERATMLVRIGETLATRGLFDLAIAEMNRAVPIFKQLGDTDRLASVYARIAQTFSDSGEVAAAAKFASDAVKEMPPSLESEGMAVLLQQTGRTHFLNGFQTEAMQYCNQALRLAERLNLPPVQADALITIGALLQNQGETEAALPKYQAGIEIAEAHRLHFQFVRGMNNLGTVYTHRGEYPLGLKYYLQGVERSRMAGLTAMEMFCLCNTGYQLLFLADFAHHDRIMARMREISSNSAPQVIWQLQMLSNECLAMRFQGQLAEGIEGFQTILQAVRGVEDWQTVSEMATVVGEMMLEQGRWDEAKSMLEEAIAATHRVSGGLTIAVSMGLLAGGHALYGDVSQARRLIKEARGSIGGVLTPVEQRNISLAEARLAVAEQRWADAFAAYDQAAQSAREQSLRWYEAYIQYEWAGVLLNRNQAGDHEAAKMLLDRAGAIFREIGTDYYVQRVEERRESIS